MDDLSQPDWTHLRAFLATADAGSLSGAARTLRLTQPTLSRQVAALEQSLSLLLFERTGRRLELTVAGRELLVHVRAMGEAATRAALTAHGQRSELSGLVRITASDMWSASFLPDAVIGLRKIAPQVSIDLIARNDIQDLMRREADIAIRHVRPTQPDLVVRKVRDATAHFYASRAYLARRGTPKTLAELSHHDWVAFGDRQQMIAHLAEQKIVLTPDAFPTGSENALVAWEMAKAGLGLCPMDDTVAADAPEMERVLADSLSVRFPVWLVTHREVHTSPRIRLVYDYLADLLATR